MLNKIDELIIILNRMQGHLVARKTAAHWVDAHIEMEQYKHCVEAGRPLAKAIQKEVAAYKASMGLSVGQNPTPEIRKRFGEKASEVLFFYNYAGVFVSSKPADAKEAFEDLKKYWLIYREDA